MRILAPTLLCLSSLAAADAGVERALRVQEGVQRSLAGQAGQSANRASLLADDLRYNRVGDEAEAAQVELLATEIAALVSASAPGVTTMATAQDLLARARRGGAVADLDLAAKAQGEIATQLDRLARAAQGSLGAANGVEDLRAAIDAQQRLLDETAKLGDQTLGKERDELAAGERADLERLARQQQVLEKALDDAAKALREQAAAAEAGDRQNLENAARELEQGKARSEARQAAEALQDNRLAEAQEHQAEVLRELQKADQALSGQQRNELTELDRRMQELARNQERQQQLLDQLARQQQMSQAELDRMRAEQQNIAEALEQQQMTAAQQEAQQAAQELAEGDRQQAQQEMQQALQSMQQAQQQMQQQMAQQRQQQDQAQQQAQQQQQGQPGQGGLEDGERKTVGRHGWEVGLEPQEREVLTQVKAEKFPTRYEQALQQYYRALAGGEE